MDDFWRHKPLDQLSPEEWESLCDGCGWCCVHKIEDIDTNEVFYTNVICRFINMHRCRCTDYENRSINVPTCVRLTPELVSKLTWLPETCAYRRIAEGEDLPEWHYLRSGDPYLVHKLGFSVRHKVINERDIDMDRLEEFVIED